MATDELCIRLFPDFGHPSSLWASNRLLVRTPESRFYLLPEDIGIEGANSERILAWTRYFHENFLDRAKDFSQRPQWKNQFDRYEWYDEGWLIAGFLRCSFPGVIVKPQFAQYVFAVNEIRENCGRAPIALPGEEAPGYVPVQEFNTWCDTENGEHQPNG